MCADSKRLSICLIQPRYHPSFWGHEYALPLMSGDKRCWTAVGALPLLAALVPAGHEVVLFDESVEPIDFSSLERFDVVGVTGMIVQRERMFEILTELAKLDVVVAAGGPYVTVSPESFAGRAHSLFLGEAEETWPEFLSALASGQPTRAVYQQAARTDMTRLPVPRFDLLKARHYFSASVQFSRGCPFQCDFCDIITIFGRRPRLKTPAQLLAELDELRKAGFHFCFLVDDNFIGNRVAVRALLTELIGWQRRNGYPLQLSTEVSVDLAEHPDLIDLMVEANILHVFVGVESPRRASLEETRKHQNTRGDGLAERIRRIRDGGLVMTAGFIVGFDADDEKIFDEQFEFIQAAGLAQAGPAILSPIPSTPLYARLAAEGRLVYDDPAVTFEPRRMSREQLRSGHRRLLERLYEPGAYFERLFRGYRESTAFRERRAALGRSIGRRTSRSARWSSLAGALLTAWRLGVALARGGRLWSLGRAYVQAYWRENRPLGRDAVGLPGFIMLCVLHWHYYRMARDRRNTEFGSAGRTAPASGLVSGIEAARPDASPDPAG